MLYMVWGIIFGQVVRDYGHGFKVTTPVGEMAMRHIGAGSHPSMVANDNELEAA